MAVTALVLGIVGMVVGLVPILFFVAWGLGISAAILGLIARRRAKRDPALGGKTMATWGAVLGLAAVAIGGVGCAIVQDVFSNAKESISSAPSGPSVTPAEPATPAPAESTTPSESVPVDNSCEAKGIEIWPTGTGMGSCTTSKGYRVKVVDSNRTLKMRGMRVSYVGSRQAASVGDSEGFMTETAHGTFVIVTVTVTNTGDTPVEIGSDWSQLELGNGKVYGEAFDAENGADENALLWREEPLSPDETATGDVIFDLPARGIRSWTRDGALLVMARLGEDLRYADTSQPIGMIRLAPSA